MHYLSLPLHHFSEDIQRFVKKKYPKGIIFGNFGACNSGDEAILTGEMAEIRKIPGVKLTVMSRYPKKVEKLHKIRAVSITKLLPTLIAIIDSDFVIVGGGGLFCRNTAGLRGILFQLYTTLLFLYLPLLLRKKVFAFGLGFYSNTNRFVATLALFALRFAESVGARDQATFKFLSNHGVPVKLYKDLSYLMSFQSTVKRFNGKKNHNKSFVVGLALNKPSGMSDKETMKKEIASFMRKHAETTHFVFYALDYHPLYASDRKFAKEILQSLGLDYSISYEYFPTFRSPQEIFSSFSGMNFMITSRFHGSVFAHRAEVPFYAIAYDVKCESFLSDIGHQYTHPASVKESGLTEYFESAKGPAHKVGPNHQVYGGGLTA